MKNKILKIAGYCLFFLCCLVFFLLQGFPVEMVGALLQNRARAAGFKLSYEEIDTLFPNGLEFDTLRLQHPRQEGGSYSLRLDSASARLSLLSLLGGHKSLSFQVDLLGGSLTGAFDTRQQGWHLQATLAGLRLDKIAFWKELLGQQLKGELGGEVELDWNPRQVKDGSGRIQLQLLGGKIGQGKIYGINLPWVDLGKTQLNLEIKKGKAEIKIFKVQSDDLEGGLDGYLLLQQLLANSSIHCRLRFKPAGELMEKIRKQIPPEFHAMLDRELNRARGSDGFYRYSIFGRIFSGRPTFRPLRQ